MSEHTLGLFAMIALGYAVLYAVEGFGLWINARWAEYLTVMSTTLFIPLELWQIGTHFTPTEITRAGDQCRDRPLSRLAVAHRIGLSRSGRAKFGVGAMMSLAPQCRPALLGVGIIIAIAGTGCGETSAPAPAEAKPSAEARPRPEPAALPLPTEAPVEAVATSQAVASPAPIAPALPLSERRDPEPSAACLAKTSDGASPVASIHRWVDAAGVTHYSDQAPVTPVSGHRVLEVRGLPDIKVEASGYDVNLPSDLQRRAIVDAVAVQRVFHDTLGIDGPSHATLKIVFVGDASAYANLVGGGVLAASSGAFVPAQHTIYVRMQADEEVAFSILRHEITHALIYERVGDLPVPLNEGLAEYFRRYRPAGMGGQIDVAADHDGLVGAAPSGDGSEALVELMALAGTRFLYGRPRPALPASLRADRLADAG